MDKRLFITDTVGKCDKCGRSDLKKTFAVGNDDDGVTGYYGSECVNKIVGRISKKGLNALEEAHRIKKAKPSKEELLNMLIADLATVETSRKLSAKYFSLCANYDYNVRTFDDKRAILFANEANGERWGTMVTPSGVVRERIWPFN